MTGDPSYYLYVEGRTHMEAARWEEAAASLSASAALSPHHKTLELLGECYMQLDRPLDAIIPLAASTTLNRGARAPSLLAEAFLQLRQFHDAHDCAKIALERDPANRRAAEVARSTPTEPEQP